ncbi:hypothetical protein KI387_012260, partial [Taxus chinensis]
APYSSELAEKLIGEIKDVFNAMPAENISERLVMVCTVYWNECRHGDLNATALGLRILRLHRYDVSSGYQRCKL